MRRFPLRTLLLMFVALIAFGRLWCVTHQEEAPSPRPGRMAQAGNAPAGAPDPSSAPECRTLERALESALRTPQDTRVLDEARQQLDACRQPPVRACALGVALDARSPLSEGEATPLRGLLASLCEHCPPAANSCARAVGQALLNAAVGPNADVASAKWNLEHAGPGLGGACASLVQLGLAPAAQSDLTVRPPVLALAGELAPHCSQAGFLDDALLRAAAVNLVAPTPALVALAAVPIPPETSAMKPDRIEGTEPSFQAFDRDEDTGVPVGKALKTKRWEADGALRASYAPTLKQLVSVRIRATGPGTVRAIVRTQQGVGLKDPEKDFAFVNPTVCRFTGTGQWEQCPLQVPLRDVDAVSVFPERADTELKELEVHGAR
ncbi:hypothetical protein [Myxococcus xanthus]|uniref:hypothetical protein n=1 Tax=Myxococcus xanthus TaxID=34 RepID=UPI00031CF55E|nr:hypothetical protein [Myxococcus xanthus]QZZ51907.1 hypothetical protein MyxoNM_22115 [Myxococcus xanthus]UYI11644.1 hypothetical protein N3T43_21440 [Myxococcus xanthus]UYI19013.1 hypothetical protein N1129_21890 [Myxococcus xanthus]SDW76733.1 hypothetical protein SAMN05444383_103418 [Myxococcus xanthus]